MPRINISQRNLRAYPRIHPKLESVLHDLLSIWPINELYITSFDRTRDEDMDLKASGIHSLGPPWRAIDIRTTTLPNLAAQDLCDSINEMWIYDPDRTHLNVAFCAPHGTGPHIHLQVHPKTTRRALA